MRQDNEFNSNSLAQEGKTMDDLGSKLRKAEQKGALITSLPKWTAIAIIVWQAAISIRGLSGAMPSLLLRIGRETTAWELVCWMAAILGLLFGAYSYHLFRRQKSQILLSYRLLENRLASLSVAGSSDAKISGASGGNQQ
jgi:hypothetical protein